MQSEVHFVSAEKEREAAGRGAGDVVGSRSVLGIVRGVDEWLPIRVADGVRVAVVVALLNGRDCSKTKWRLLSQAVMVASAIPRLTSAKRRALSSMLER